MHPDSEVIKALGGPSALAKKLGFGPFGAQRVQNWMYRGIPALIRLKHQSLFRKAKQAA